MERGGAIAPPPGPFSNFSFPVSALLTPDVHVSRSNTPPAGGDSASDTPDPRNASPPNPSDTPDPHDHPNCDNRDDASHTPAHPPTAPPSSSAQSSPTIPSKSVPRQRERHTSQASLPKIGVSSILRRSKFQTSPNQLGCRDYAILTSKCPYGPLLIFGPKTLCRLSSCESDVYIVLASAPRANSVVNRFFALPISRHRHIRHPERSEGSQNSNKLAPASI